QVDLAVKTRNPECVDYIGGAKLDVDWPMRGNVNFIGGDDRMIRVFDIVDLPPPLMSDDQDIRPGLGCHRAMVHCSMVAVNWKSGQQVQTEEEEDGKHQERNGQTADHHPFLATAHIDRHMLAQRSGILQCSYRQEHPHHDRGDYERDGDGMVEIRNTPRRGSKGIGYRL